MENYDAEELRNLFEDIAKNNVILEQEFMDQIEDMLEAAEDNPDYQAEKLAEAKKAGKAKGKAKGKKKK